MCRGKRDGKRGCTCGIALAEGAGARFTHAEGGPDGGEHEMRLGAAHVFGEQGAGGSLAVLHWNQICFGAAAFINGQRVGEHVTTGPYQVMLPPGVLKEGENTIVLKVTGPAGVRASKTGHILIPAGFTTAVILHRTARAQISDDVWIDFAGERLSEMGAGHARPGTELRAPARDAGGAGDGRADADRRVRAWPNGKRAGARPGAGGRGARHRPAERGCIPLSSMCRCAASSRGRMKQPFLYTAHVTLSRGTQVLDEVDVRFGMREISVKDGHYQLNGKHALAARLRAGGRLELGARRAGHEVDYLVTEAREMSMNAFRTHTLAAAGEMGRIFATSTAPCCWRSFRCSTTRPNYHFTPEEYAIWHQNVLDDAAGWMGHLWNHPVDRARGCSPMSRTSTTPGRWGRMMRLLTTRPHAADHAHRADHAASSARAITPTGTLATMSPRSEEGSSACSSCRSGSPARSAHDDLHANT